MYSHFIMHIYYVSKVENTFLFVEIISEISEMIKKNHYQNDGGNLCAKQDYDLYPYHYSYGRQTRLFLNLRFVSYC